MRRAMSRKADASERSPPKASMIVQAVSRTTWASLTKLRCASRPGQSAPSTSVAAARQSIWHTAHTRRAKGCWCATHPPAHAASRVCKAVPEALVRASLTKASSKRKRLAGTSVIRMVQSAKRNVSSETGCCRRCASGSRVGAPLVANLLRHAQQQQAHGEALAGSHLHAQLFHLPYLGW